MIAFADKLIDILGVIMMLFEDWLIHQKKVYADNMTEFFAVLTMKIGNRVLKLTEPTPVSLSNIYEGQAFAAVNWNPKIVTVCYLTLKNKIIY